LLVSFFFFLSFILSKLFVIYSLTIHSLYAHSAHLVQRIIRNSFRYFHVIILLSHLLSLTFLHLFNPSHIFSLVASHFLFFFDIPPPPNFTLVHVFVPPLLFSPPMTH
jgi:hypothetical protein